MEDIRGEAEDKVKNATNELEKKKAAVAKQENELNVKEYDFVQKSKTFTQQTKQVEKEVEGLKATIAERDLAISQSAQKVDELVQQLEQAK